MTRRPFTLTRRGWTVAGAAVGLLAGGRLLGADELSVLGVATLAVLGLCGAWLAATRPALTVTRRVDPARLQVGDTARVDLVVRATRATPLMEITDTAGQLRAAFLLAPLHAGATAAPAYRLPTDQRGPLVLGPTIVSRTDPLGLTGRVDPVAPAETVLVRPRVFPIALPVLGAGRRHSPDDTESPRAPAHEAGGEFLAVRPYEVGDDPRRVHWRSSARVDDLMVRQFVAPRRGHTVVVLDTRSADALTEHRRTVDPGAGDITSGNGHVTDPAFERAVEATASIVASLMRARRPMECITTAGTVIATSGSDLQRALDRLATVMMDEPDGIDAVARAWRRRGSELVIVVSARADRRVQAARHMLSRLTGSLLVMTGGDLPERAAHGRVVDARRVAFPDAWRAANPAHRSGRPLSVGNPRP